MASLQEVEGVTSNPVGLDTAGLGLGDRIRLTLGERRSSRHDDRAQRQHGREAGCNRHVPFLLEIHSLAFLSLSCAANSGPPMRLTARRAPCPKATRTSSRLPIRCLPSVPAQKADLSDWLRMAAPGWSWGRPSLGPWRETPVGGRFHGLTSTPFQRLTLPFANVYFSDSFLSGSFTFSSLRSRELSFFNNLPGCTKSRSGHRAGPSQRPDPPPARHSRSCASHLSKVARLTPRVSAALDLESSPPA